MPNANAAALIAENLALLPHPDGKPRQLVGYTTDSKPSGLANQITKNAQDIGDAIVNLLELNGAKITFDAEQATAEPSPIRQPEIVEVRCHLCNTRLLRLNITNAPRLRTNPETFINAMQKLTADCDSGHGVR